MKKIISIIALTALSVFTHAEDEWIKVSESITTDAYLSANRIKNKTDLYSNESYSKIEAWVRFVFKKDDAEMEVKKGSTIMALYQFSCPAERVIRHEAIMYDKAGNILYEDDEPSSDRVIPGSANDYITMAACNFITNK